MKSSRLDTQLNTLNLDYQILPEGLPRPPLGRPVFPVLAKINGTTAFCLLAHDSILDLCDLPEPIQTLERFPPEYQRTLCRNLGLEKITLLCGKARVFFDTDLLQRDSLTLPLGDRSHYVKIALRDLLAVLGDNVTPVHFTKLAITPDENLDNSSFSRFRIRQAMADLSSIPPFPVTARSIIKISQQPIIPPQGLTDILIRDPLIASSVLSWANSKALRQQYGEIRTISQAVERIGVPQVMDFALQASMMKSFKTTENLTSIIQFATYNALHSAYGARLATTSQHSQHPCAKEAYLTGLMYNLGELLLAHCFPELAGVYLATQQINPHLSREVLAREVFKLSFSGCTDLLMETWNIPTSMAESALALASHSDKGQNPIANAIRLWQISMLDGGYMPYAHAPHGWDQYPSFPLGKETVTSAIDAISEIMTFSTTVAKSVH